MANDRINMSHGELVNYSNQCKTYGEDLLQTVSSLGTLMENISACFDGATSDAYYQQYNDFRPIAERTGQTVIDCVIQLKQIADNFRELDETMRHQIMG